MIGAGPAGLTFAHEWLSRTGKPVSILESSDMVGGISRTVVYKGNRIDIGGHRFFSKDDRVMAWWRARMPVQSAPARDDLVLGRPVEAMDDAPPDVTRPSDPERDDHVMLVRRRLSRIYYLRKFFSYPVSLSLDTIRNLGLVRMTRIGFSYLWMRAMPPRKERSLEDFFINRFGGELYRTFFRDYTEKVWGVACREIKPEWGAQRIKGLSIRAVLAHALRQLLPKRKTTLAQKDVETSLIDRFMYPRLGPGQMWEIVADDIKQMGGTLDFHRTCTGLRLEGSRVVAVEVEDPAGRSWHDVDLVVSTMPLQELVKAAGDSPPNEVREIAEGLRYRDFFTVGVLVKKLKLRNDSRIPTVNGIVPDNWIYIQEPDVRVGRLQVFNNWSPYMVAEPDTVWLGMEYFANEGDDLWSQSDDSLAELGLKELVQMGIVEPEDVLDRTVLRAPKAYPAYFGSYDRIDVLRRWLDSLDNL
ncbi:MAG: NAD(P)/FAD-dependent oxidoreductase, partial [Candidatus Sericytochromatia bacterium]|nr:NAD(P)/FAD-dependent oxidoreductase [Candidatus Sericytochromatia bacterium]